MDFIAFAKNVHNNAIVHGWWDEPRDLDEIVALICSEWSEALEEYRAGRPMVWYECMACGEPCKLPCKHATAFDYCDIHARSPKPEGIAVELIDGCIRILDYLVSTGQDPVEPDKLLGENSCTCSCAHLDLPHLVAYLHAETVTAWRNAQQGGGRVTFSRLIFSVFEWIRQQGLEPEEIMYGKHEYNITRPYKHGKII